MSSISELVENIIVEERLNNHGSHAFSRLKDCLGKKKTNKILNYLKETQYQAPISWDNVKNEVWACTEQQDNNQFLFLQGDIIETTMVSSLEQGRLAQQHGLWLICSPTCDVTRGPDYIKVAKIFTVYQSDKEVSSDRYKEFQKLYMGTKFLNNKSFPLAAFPKDEEDIMGYYADLTTPYYIKRNYLGSATAVHSLKLNAWHLLNTFLMQIGTRSNPEDEPSIRCIAEGLPKINSKRKDIRVYYGKGEDDYSVLALDCIDCSDQEHLLSEALYTGRWVNDEGFKSFWFTVEGLSFEEIKLKQ